MRGDVATGVVVEGRPLVTFLYRLLYDGDLSPGRLEEVLEQLEGMPPAIATRFGLPDLGRYAVEGANRLDRLARPPIAVERPAAGA